MAERRRAQVWIADDDESIRFVLAEALREAGVEVRAFADADSLRGALARTQPDVVVSDIRMPGTNGLEFLADLRAAGSLLPVIVMSAFTDVASTAAAYRSGAFDYLQKPFDLDEAVAAVHHEGPADRSTQAADPGSQLIPVGMG